ncbi:MAG: ParB N-terminal domain-containing protein [Methyloprofundus sp.]|nr:ParB N-terminal domain-containing protein [Methyloprofundus sp.]
MSKIQKNIPGIDLMPGDTKKAMQKAGAKSNPIIWSVPIDEICVIDNFNVRCDNTKNSEFLQSLIESIESEGFHQDKPLSGTVKNVNGEDRVYIYDGHTRLKASKAVRAKGIPLEALPVVINKSLNVVDLNVNLIRSNSGLPLSLYEEALVVKRLHSLGLTQQEIVKRTGAHKNKVSDFLSYLLPSPPAIHNWVINEDISVNFAVEMIKRYGAESVERIEKSIEKAKKEGLGRAPSNHAPDANFKRFLRKRAPVMTNILTRIHLSERLMKVISEHDSDLAQEIASLAQEGGSALDEAISARPDSKNKERA